MKNKQNDNALDKDKESPVQPDTKARHKRVRSRKVAVRLAFTAGIIVFLLSAFYLGLSEYYKDGFSYGTWINGIYCTGKSVDEVNQELLATCSYAGLTVYDKEGGAYEITAEEIGFSFDFKEALEKYLEQQNPYLWMNQMFMAKERTITPVISYKEELLEQAVQKIPEIADITPDEMRRVYIHKTDDGYELVNERLGVLNKQNAREVIAQAILAFDETLDLEKAGCYEDLPYNTAMKEKLVQWEKISAFQDCGIVYKMGEEQIPVDASVVCDWMLLKENGSFQLDEEGNLMPDDEKIEEFIDKLADEYDTVGGVRQFQTTRGDIINIEGGIYGNKLDRKAEKAYLKQAFRDKVREVHTPQYLQQGMAQGKNDIGDTYIEVDMTKQMMYYYQNGKLEVETPIVTGNTGRRMGTPEGVNYVYSKQKNRILRGPGYASHVNFWMPVKGNIGIHDASWRSEYGGEIYKTGGSHGCINTPYDAMSRLYEMAEVGTPVIMFY